MSAVDTGNLLLREILNPLLFLAAGFLWVLLKPRIAGSWLLLIGAIPLFANKALRHSGSQPNPISSEFWAQFYEPVIAIAPAMIGVGIFLTVIRIVRDQAQSAQPG